MSQLKSPDELMERYLRLQRYVQWSDDDAARVCDLAPLASSTFESLVEDFYDTVEREPNTAKVIIGGAEQVRRLKNTLLVWLRDLFSGRYDSAYVGRRWRVGWQHVEIGLEQAFTNVAMARLRSGLAKAIEQQWRGGRAELVRSLDSLHRLIDLDSAIIQDAYEAEYVLRQRRVERQRSEEAFRRLVEAAGSMIVILREDCTIAYFNPFAEKLTGFAATAVMGKDYTEIFLANEYVGIVRKDIAKVFAGSPTDGLEYPVKCRHGGQRWVVWNAQWLDNFAGSTAVLAIGQDVTDQKLAVERALQSERLAAIGQTVAGLAHESRNAFQRSQACLELLELELAGRADELELVARIQRALNHLHRLYNEVRDYAAPIKLDYQMCDLAHVWRDAWAQLEVDRKGKNVQLQETINGIDLNCVVDWFTIGQVFRNILENAIAACPDPGQVEIRCQQHSSAGQDWVEIAIQDNGPGIEPDARAKVFDAFFTTRNKGTGLGMAITSRIIEAHGGSIRLGSAGGGAEFVISLPRHKLP